MKKTIATSLFLLIWSTSIFAQWTFRHYVDEFGDSTGDPYIINVDANGDFTNSATNGSRLIVHCLISYIEGDSLPTIRFDMYEYGGGVAVGKTIGDANYSLTIKLADETKEEYSLDAGEDALYLEFFNSDQTKKFIGHLKKESKPIKCLIVVDGDYSTQTYRFKLNPVGFSSAFSKIKSKNEIL